MAESRGIKIFLGHASDDKTAVLSLYERLKKQGYDPWLDKLNLLPGDNWREEIPKAIKSSDIFIACLSPRSVDKDGYVQQELRIALMECARKSVKGVYLIPLRLEPCEIPDLQLPDLGVNLRDYHWLDYWESGSFELLVRSIERKRPSPYFLSSEPLADPVIQSFPDSPSVSFSKVSKVKLQRFNFEVVTVDSRGWETDRRTAYAEHFLEELGNGIFLDMVQMSGGEFLMGSPEDEPERRDSEGPQHRVIVPEFFMNRHLVTQSQWRVVTGLAQVNRELMVDPSKFKGSNRPVEQVSWLEAMEFCNRLSRLSGRQYSLPSEAQWEYACRAGSTTPFHCGMALSSGIANYYDEANYRDGHKSGYRKRTTEVEQFLANGFGLCDMHGNVWEWCQDQWHTSYDGAPTDGSAWVDENDQRSHSVRGGSWASDSRDCRCAYRRPFNPHDQYSYLGFRVVCSAPMT